MSYSEEYEHYLEKEVARCDSLYAFCQEIAWHATSEMTELEHRQEDLLADLKCLRESRELYSLPVPPLNYDYTPNQLSIQETASSIPGTASCVFTDRCIVGQSMQIQDEEVTM